MKKSLFILLTLFATSSLLFAQNTSWGFTLGGQLYQQEQHYKSASLLTLENAGIERANTIEFRSIRPVIGLEFRKISSANRLLKFSTAYTTSEFQLDKIVFRTDNNGDLAGVDIESNIGTTRSHHGSIAFDHGIPLMENSEKWQFYIAGQAALVFEHENHNPNISTLFPTSESFYGTRLGFAPDLTYQFEQMQLSMQLLVPFASFGFVGERVENPTSSPGQNRTEGIDFELFGIKQANLKIGLSWQI